MVWQFPTGWLKNCELNHAKFLIVEEQNIFKQQYDTRQKDSYTYILTTQRWSV
jgi:hypothetical protein